MRVIERLTAVQIQLRSTLSTQVCGLKPQLQPRPIPVLRREPAKSLYRKRLVHPAASHLTFRYSSWTSRESGFLLP